MSHTYCTLSCTKHVFRSPVVVLTPHRALRCWGGHLCYDPIQSVFNTLMWSGSCPLRAAAGLFLISLLGECNTLVLCLSEAMLTLRCTNTTLATITSHWAGLWTRCWLHVWRDRQRELPLSLVCCGTRSCAHLHGDRLSDGTREQGHNGKIGRLLQSSPQGCILQFTTAGTCVFPVRVSKMAAAVTVWGVFSNMRVDSAVGKCWRCAQVKPGLMCVAGQNGSFSKRASLTQPFRFCRRPEARGDGVKFPLLVCRGWTFTHRKRPPITPPTFSLL